MDERPDELPRYLVPASLNALCDQAGSVEDLLRSPSPLRWSRRAPRPMQCELPCHLPELDQQQFFFGKPPAEFDRRYTFAQSDLCAFPRAAIVGEAHAVIVPPRYLLLESCRSREVLEKDGLMQQFDATVDEESGARDVSLVALGHPPAPRRVDGTVLLLSQYWQSNYHHWLLECLPRLRWCMEEPLLADALIVGPPAGTKFQRDTLRMLGLEPRVLAFDAGYWQCESLLFPSLGSLAPEELSWLRRELAESESWTLGTQPGERLYVSRSKARGRRVINEDGLKAVLRRHGFAIVHPEDGPLEKQIERFARASVIAGPHGSGLTNALFAPADALLIELAPADRPNHCYWVLANALGQRYAFLAGPVVNDARDFEVPVRSLERVLKSCI